MKSLTLSERALASLDKIAEYLLTMYPESELCAAGSVVTMSAKCDCGGGCAGSCVGGCGGCGKNCKGGLKIF